MGINIRRQYAHAADPEQLKERFETEMDSEGNPFNVSVAQDLVTLRIRRASTSWWSPEMNLRFQPESGETVIYELVGPNSATFTLAMFFMIAGVVGFLVAFIWAAVQWQLGHSSLLAVVASLFSGSSVVITLTVLAFGRHQAQEQVQALRDYIGRVLLSV